MADSNSFASEEISSAFLSALILRLPWLKELSNSACPTLELPASLSSTSAWLLHSKYRFSPHRYQKVECFYETFHKMVESKEARTLGHILLRDAQNELR